MTEKQLRDERRALLTWFARNEHKEVRAHWQRNIDRLKAVNFELSQITANPIFKARDND